MTHKKTDDVYKDIAEDVETRFDTSNYKLNRALPKWKNKKAIGVVKVELGKSHERICWIKSKNLLGSEDKKAKGTKKGVIKRKRKFEVYKNYLEATQLENKINHLEKIEIDVDIVKNS